MAELNNTERIDALEQRIVQLSNENNGTYQYCVQIAKAHNALCDVVEAIIASWETGSLEVPYTVDNARIPNTNSAETGMKLVDDYTEGRRIVEEREREVQKTVYEDLNKAIPYISYVNGDFDTLTGNGVHIEVMDDDFLHIQVMDTTIEVYAIKTETGSAIKVNVPDVGNAVSGTQDKPREQRGVYDGIRGNGIVKEEPYDLQNFSNGTQEAKKEGLLEQLAEAQHEIWSSWMRWMFDNGGKMYDYYTDGVRWEMFETEMHRWKRQMNTPYAELSEEEKESDRLVVLEHLDFLLEAQDDMDNGDRIDSVGALGNMDDIGSVNAQTVTGCRPSVDRGSAETVDAQLKTLRDKLEWSNVRTLSRERGGVGCFRWFLSHTTLNSIESMVRPVLEEWAQKVAELEAVTKYGRDEFIELNKQHTISKKRAEQAEAERDALKTERDEYKDALPNKDGIILSHKEVQDIIAERDALKAEVARLRECIISYLNVAESKSHYDSSAEWFASIHRCEAKMKQALESEGNE